MSWTPTLSVRHRTSVFCTHPDHNEHRVILFRMALDQRPRSSWLDGKRRLLCLGGLVALRSTENKERCSTVYGDDALTTRRTAVSSAIYQVLR